MNQVRSAGLDEAADARFLPTDAQEPEPGYSSNSTTSPIFPRVIGGRGRPQGGSGAGRGLARPAEEAHLDPAPQRVHPGPRPSRLRCPPVGIRGPGVKVGRGSVLQAPVDCLDLDARSLRGVGGFIGTERRDLSGCRPAALSAGQLLERAIRSKGVKRRVSPVAVGAGGSRPSAMWGFNWGSIQ